MCYTVPDRYPIPGGNTMKKRIAIILLAAAVLSLAACGRGGSQPSPTAAPSPTPNTDDLAIMAASDTDATASRQSHVPPASATDLEIDAAAYDKAIDCIGLTIFDLYAAIGQPLQAPAYAPSSVQDDAQDGTLTYKGFTVWTLRTDAQEIVHEVYLDSELEDAAQQSADQAAQPTDLPAVG